MAVIHGNKSQGARERALGDFKAGRVAVLVATDIAARGLDIAQLPLVVNYNLPLVAEDYIHRVGRTGRAGLTGRAISLVSPSDRPLLNEIERLLPSPIEHVGGGQFEARPAPAPEPPPDAATIPHGAANGGRVPALEPAPDSSQRLSLELTSCRAGQATSGPSGWSRL